MKRLPIILGLLLGGSALAAGISVGLTLLSGEDQVANVLISETGRFSYTNITANATTTIKSGAGYLASILVGNHGSTGDVITLYDNTAASGTKIGTFTTLIGAAPSVIEINTGFTTGLTAVTATGVAFDLTFIYR
jgi:hypothetical protein